MRQKRVPQHQQSTAAVAQAQNKRRPRYARLATYDTKPISAPAARVSVRSYDAAGAAAQNDVGWLKLRESRCGDRRLYLRWAKATVGRLRTVVDAAAELHARQNSKAFGAHFLAMRQQIDTACATCSTPLRSVTVKLNSRRASRVARATYCAFPVIAGAKDGPVRDNPANSVLKRRGGRGQEAHRRTAEVHKQQCLCLSQEK
jgi:hypothetical protein